MQNIDETVYVELGRLFLQCFAIVLQKAAEDPELKNAIIDAMSIKVCKNECEPKTSQIEP